MGIFEEKTAVVLPPRQTRAPTVSNGHRDMPEVVGVPMIDAILAENLLLGQVCEGCRWRNTSGITTVRADYCRPPKHSGASLPSERTCEKWDEGEDYFF